MTQEIWNTAPPDDVFEEIQKAAIKIWKTYDDEFGYATGKIEKVNSLENVGSNYMTIYQMFDAHNQIKLLTSVRRATAQRIMEAVE